MFSLVTNIISRNYQSIQNMNVEKAKSLHIEKIAYLHRENIKTGFLSKLGLPFLTLLYYTMSNSANAFCVVAIDNNKIVGFSSGAICISAFYKDFLKVHFLKASMILLPKVLNFRFLKKMIETLFYPARKKQNLPMTELLSIALDKNYRGKGIAEQLFGKIVEEFRSRDIKCFKVVVGSELIAARKFYEKMGGVFCTEIEVHNGKKSRVYVWET